MVKKGHISLAEMFPEIALEWHPTKNGNLKPTDISYGSAQKVYWLGKCGHEWLATCNHRTQGEGCSVCSEMQRRKTHKLNWIKKHGSLADKNPELAKQWHPTKNGNLTTNDVSANSEYKAWWICDQGHEWDASISSRNRGSNCPICSGHRILVGCNDLATVNPGLAKEWHPTKNGLLTPQDVTSKNGNKVWWMCEKGHEWETKICNRSNGNSCPVCSGKKVFVGYNDLETNRPDIAKDWHPTKNGESKPSEVTCGSNKKVWWICERGHEWETSISHRTQGEMCPKCYGESKTSFPEQAIYFYCSKFTTAYNRYMIDSRTEIDVYLPDYKIGIEYDGIYYHTGEKAYIKEKLKNEKLSKLGIYLIRVEETKNKNDLPENCIYAKTGYRDSDLSKTIRNLLIHISTKINLQFDIDINIEQDRIAIYEQYVVSEKARSLLALNPRLALEWHPTKNGKLLPEHVSASSNKRAWWQCENGHEWEANINSRNQTGARCPYCAGLKVMAGENDLATINPEIASQWHPTRNGDFIPSDFLPYSNKKVWWQCENGHEWIAFIRDRSKGGKCPYCKK